MEPAVCFAIVAFISYLMGLVAGKVVIGTALHSFVAIAVYLVQRVIVTNVGE